MEYLLVRQAVVVTVFDCRSVRPEKSWTEISNAYRDTSCDVIWSQCLGYVSLLSCRVVWMFCAACTAE